MSSLQRHDDWDKRQCRPSNGLLPNYWFSGSSTPEGRMAKSACMSCPLKISCREYALREGIPEGIYGGLDGEDRAQVWEKSGGKPSKFLDIIDEHFGALLRERRNREGMTT